MKEDVPLRVRRLVVVFGDQLDEFSPVFEGFDPEQDLVWMGEVRGEATHVPSSKGRIVQFLAAMRHFRDRLRGLGYRVVYRALGDSGNLGTLEAELRAFLARSSPAEVWALEPGEWRLREGLRAVLWPGGGGDWMEDTHFLCTHAEFRSHVAGRKQWRMEFFYREMRRRHRILMEGEQPTGGQWNFDQENRGSFGKDGPGLLPAPVRFNEDSLTAEVARMVEEVFPEAPGSARAFDFPVNREQALEALRDFVENRLAHFGLYQDAMWSGQPWLYHARLSAAMNLKLLNPREVIGAAEEAWRRGVVGLASAEGFIRQVLGWREYVRGVYWLTMPGFLEQNALKARVPLPDFYWSGDTPMRCLREVITQTLRYGYAHHIQRLMVTGLYALMLGVEPKRVHEWYLSVYVDAVEWVELPNTLGMSQYADGGRLASKPYAATGKYIQRMSDYCTGCVFDPARAHGAGACPFTTLYWDFLARNRDLLAGNQRMSLQLKNLERLEPGALAAIRSRAAEIQSANGAVCAGA